MDNKPKILFFSTGDATRSQMAEGFLRRFAGEALLPVSTAVHSVEADPLAHEVMNEVGVDISRQRATAVAESFKEHFAYVVTVRDASREKFPVWPFARNILHWNLADPELAKGTPEQKREAFRRVRDETRNKVEEFLAQLAYDLGAKA